MKMTTQLNREYALRLLGVGAMLLFATGWFYYDGTFTYPSANEATAPVCATLVATGKTARELVNTDKGEKSLFAQAFDKAGVEVPGPMFDIIRSVVTANAPEADDVKYAQHALKQPIYSPQDIQAQFTSAMVAAFFMCVILVLLLKRKFTTYTLEDNQLIVAHFGKEKVYLLDQLTLIDQARWTNKNILLVFFKTGLVKLDAWHYMGVSELYKELINRFPEKTSAPTAE